MANLLLRQFVAGPHSLSQSASARLEQQNRPHPDERFAAFESGSSSRIVVVDRPDERIDWQEVFGKPRRKSGLVFLENPAEGY